MKINRAAISVAVAVTSIVAAVAGLRQGQQANAASTMSTPSRTRALAAARQADDPNRSQQTIQFFAGRVKKDPKSAIDCALLAGFYLQRCRETGDIADAQRAEAAARRSIAIRQKNNQSGYAELALSLFTEHRFPEALAVASYVSKKWGDSQATTTLIEIETEAGDDQKALHLLSGLSVAPKASATMP